MKDALREYGRTVAIFAAAGLVLSLLVGLLARNPFGVMLLRAVLFAIAFGAIGAGMQYVVRRFLPELAGGDAGGPRDTDDAAAKPGGSTIDIVLPEEPPPPVGTPGEPGERQEERLEELPGSGDAGGAVVVEELEGADSAPAPASEPPAGPAPGPVMHGDGPSEGADALDSLPDIGSIGADDAAPRSASRPPGARTKPSDVTRDVLERTDPASLARAVHTVMKRDERP